VHPSDKDATVLSRTIEYALRAAVWLASRPDTAQTTRQVAAATKVPTGYLSKVLQLLAEAGLVNSQRGLGGGFVLARPAGKITVLDVMNAVDPIERIHSCPLKLKAHERGLCLLHRKLDDALALIETTFRESTLADLQADPAAESPLCAGTRPRTPAAGKLARSDRSSD
jgi:Rrf2 family protein